MNVKLLIILAVVVTGIVLSIIFNKFEYVLLVISGVLLYILFKNIQLSTNIKVTDYIPIVLTLLTLSYSVYGAIQLPRIENQKFKEISDMNATYIKNTQKYITQNWEQEISISTEENVEISAWVWKAYVNNVKGNTQNMKSTIQMNNMTPKNIKNYLIVLNELNSYEANLDFITLSFESENKKNENKNEYKYKVSKELLKTANTSLSESKIIKQLTDVANGKRLTYK